MKILGGCEILIALNVSLRVGNRRPPLQAEMFMGVYQHLTPSKTLRVNLTMTEINRQVYRLALTSPNVDVCRPNAWVPTNNALFFPVFCIQHVQRNAQPQISKLHMGIIESVRELCKIGKWPLQYFLCPSQQAVLTSFIRGQCGAQSNVTKCYHSVSHTIRWRDPLM